MTRDRSLEQAVLSQDLTLVAVSLFLAHFVHARVSDAVPMLKPPVPAGEYAYLLLVFLPTWVLVARRFGIHRMRTLTGPAPDLVRRVLLAQGWGLAVIAGILVAAQVSLNRSLIGIFVALSTALLLGAKVIQRRALWRRRGRSLVLLVGGGGGGVAETGAQSPEIERLRGRRVERFDSVDPAALAARFQAGPVDEVVLVGAPSFETARRLVAVCAEAGLPVLVPFEDVGGSAPDLPPPMVELVGSSPYLVYERRRSDGPALVIKAMLDRVLAAALIVLAAPLLALLAFLVRVFIGGPFLYVQQRAGLLGSPFPMLKFRTMRLGADREQQALRVYNEMDGPVFKMSNDPRVTRLGRILRRSSLDELPQLFNVLAGQMSLVGPRPLPVDETRALYGEHRRRLSMRPGITCLWQVSGRSDLPFREWMALDIAYVDRWSLTLDAAILLRTVPAILRARGAR